MAGPRGHAEPRRIAVGLESSGPGGAEQMVLHLAQGLRDASFEPMIVSLRPGWMTDRASKLGIPVAILPQRRGLDLAWMPRFARWLRRNHIEVFHSHEFAMNVFGGAAAAWTRTPHVATVHGRRWVADRTRRVLAYRGLLRTGMRLVAVSHDLAGYLTRRLGIPPDAVRIVHNGIELPAPVSQEQRDRARRSLGLPRDRPVLVAVGNLYPVKDHATLLRAAARLRDAHVAIAGRGGEEAGLRELARELGIAERVHLLGLRDDVGQVLASADLFVQPSRSEGLPLAILEAMGAGLPIVATRVGGIPEAVVDGESGRLVAPGDPVELANAIEALLDATQETRALGRAARARAEVEFSLTAMVERYRALYAGR